MKRLAKIINSIFILAYVRRKLSASDFNLKHKFPRGMIHLQWELSRNT